MGGGPGEPPGVPRATGQRFLLSGLCSQHVSLGRLEVLDQRGEGRPRAWLPGGPQGPGFRKPLPSGHRGTLFCPPAPPRGLWGRPSPESCTFPGRGDRGHHGGGRREQLSPASSAGRRVPPSPADPHPKAQLRQVKATARGARSGRVRVAVSSSTPRSDHDSHALSQG